MLPHEALRRDMVIATPTMKRKNGNTRSVGVQPSHLECSSGGKTLSQSPGLLTTTIVAIVRPRNTSSQAARAGADTLRPATPLDTAMPPAYRGRSGGSTALR